MTTREEQRQLVIERLSRHLLDVGLAQASLRQLAAAAGVSDRMLLYYFSDKAEVMATALASVAGQMTARFAEAIPAGILLPPNELVVRAASFTAQDDMRRFMRLWIEVLAAAAKREEPFVTVAAQIMAGFQQWVDQRLDVPPGTDREAVAAAIIALVDGLALVEMCSGEIIATRAVAAIASLFGGSAAR